MRFAQVKFLAKDVVGLTRFYVDAIGCSVLREAAEFDDPDLVRAIGAQRGVRVILAVLGLPGQSEEGAILELYSLVGTGVESWPFQSGQGHIAFEVEDLDGMVPDVLANGGSLLGTVTDWQAPSGNVARFVYLRDPEGNLVDLYEIVSA